MVENSQRPFEKRMIVVEGAVMAGAVVGVTTFEAETGGELVGAPVVMVAAAAVAVAAASTGRRLADHMVHDEDLGVVSVGLQKR